MQDDECRLAHLICDSNLRWVAQGFGSREQEWGENAGEAESTSQGDRRLKGMNFSR
jgi:hypothetical protein